MSIHKTEAIVLNRRPFRETSLIADFFTLEFGKISGLLKGIRTEPKKFASSVDLFSLNEIIFYRKQNSDIQLVSQCDLKNNFDAIRRDVTRVSLASVMIELLHAVMPAEEKNEEIFSLAHSSLQELGSCANPEKITTIFKIKLLSLSGFKPHLDSCVSCGNKILSQSKFSLALGGLICTTCNHKDKNARLIFRGTVATILHIEKNELKNNLNLGINPQIKRELNLILNAFLTYHLERSFKAQRVLEGMQKADALPLRA
ncbi:MAG: DNA repair protein RecO [Candidatus Omnitrophota bacterium]|nr:MAG: DNA repair protein RecO [Candidatus Omnitrophota bacterium]